MANTNIPKFVLDDILRSTGRAMGLALSGDSALSDIYADFTERLLDLYKARG
ncbi:hypothetical protein SAMN05421776_11736 [Nocardia farcinica]|uniref:Uncharacterized protein n=1 Tax=Nocardia farcinica TaxID=37329 RepID=A0A0H5NWY4_NOCFR|nr:hypothetical protein [Nocardia farcinica]PFW99043.1 hypothetical protein CJ469_05643 [Nocardia farcinica]PFX06081.1 hypothetical protein CJ468_04941 [Nocardia farcinica]CRY79823.1 Uncharacterised protein [Nocardia farcinica]SIT33609.1 hypothetical protein SAMN05421776_11736 [Nocardia farcinica]